MYVSSNLLLSFVNHLSLPIVSIQSSLFLRGSTADVERDSSKTLCSFWKCTVLLTRDLTRRSCLPVRTYNRSSYQVNRERPNFDPYWRANHRSRITKHKSETQLPLPLRNFSWGIFLCSLYYNFVCDCVFRKDMVVPILRL